MNKAPITTKAKIWKWNEMKGSWHFVTLNATALKWVETVKPKQRRGFGSIPVTVRVGLTTWKTSLFPDKTRGYVMPIKSKVMKAESLKEGKTVTFMLERDRAR